MERQHRQSQLPQSRDMGPPPVDESEAADDLVLDYSRHRRRLELPNGVTKTADGRFGGGLHANGKGALAIASVPLVSLEGWIRVEALPEKTACIWSVFDDETRLLLHPDGRLELRLRHPHGRPGEYPGQPLTDAQRALVLAKDAEIVSPAPVVRPGVWIHVAIENKRHNVPGVSISPWEAMLRVNGEVVDSYLSENWNHYLWLGDGRRTNRLIVGNSASGDQDFAGTFDEIRASTQPRVYYERPPEPWREANHELQFDRPYFREDGTLRHLSLAPGTPDDGNGMKMKLMAGKIEDLTVPGIRGTAWRIDPDVGFPRLSLEEVPAGQGSLEFWVRPVNFDDVTGYWSHSPPSQHMLTILTAMAQPVDGEPQPWYRMGDRGVSMGRLPVQQGELDASWYPRPPWGEFVQMQRQNPELNWQAFSSDYVKKNKNYGFWGHVDINNRDRGLYWFADNAAGWMQSPKKDALALRADGSGLDLNRTDIDLYLEDRETIATRERERFHPRIKDKTLILTVRGRDYRVIELQREDTVNAPRLHDPGRPRLNRKDGQ